MGSSIPANDAVILWTSPWLCLLSHGQQLMTVFCSIIHSSTDQQLPRLLSDNNDKRGKLLNMCYHLPNLFPSRVCCPKGVEGKEVMCLGKQPLSCSLLASIEHLNFWGSREGAALVLGAGGTELALLNRFVRIPSNSMHTCISAGAHNACRKKQSYTTKRFMRAFSGEKYQLLSLLYRPETEAGR